MTNEDRTIAMGGAREGAEQRPPGGVFSSSL